jgi:hypothetical protein
MSSLRSWEGDLANASTTSYDLVCDFAGLLNVRLSAHDRGTPNPHVSRGLVNYLTDVFTILEMGQAPYALDRAGASGLAVVRNRSRRFRAPPGRRASAQTWCNNQKMENLRA